MRKSIDSVLPCITAIWLAVTAGTGTVAGVLYPDLEFARLPFNNPGTVEVGCGYLGRATPVDADGDGDWDLVVCGNGFGGGAMFYENPGDAAKTGVFRKGVRGKNVCAGWRFAMREGGGYALTAPDKRLFSFVIKTDEEEIAFAKAAETYLLNHLEHRFDCLDFYNSVAD